MKLFTLLQTEICQCSKLKAVNRKCHGCGAISPRALTQRAKATRQELLAAVSSQELLSILDSVESKRM